MNNTKNKTLNNNNTSCRIYRYRRTKDSSLNLDTKINHLQGATSLVDLGGFFTKHSVAILIINNEYSVTFALIGAHCGHYDNLKIRLNSYLFSSLNDFQG